VIEQRGGARITPVSMAFCGKESWKEAVDVGVQVLNKVGGLINHGFKIAYGLGENGDSWPGGERGDRRALRQKPREGGDVTSRGGGPCP